MKVVTEEMRRKAMEYGWSSEQVKKGYTIFSRNKVGNGATHIQRIDSLMKFDNDDEAAKYAEEVDGVKLIHDIQFEPRDLNYANYVDTPENRKLLYDIIRENVKTKVSILYGNQIELSVIVNGVAKAIKPLGVNLSDDKILEMKMEDFIDLIDVHSGKKPKKTEFDFRYEKQEMECKVGDILHNNNGNDYRVMEKYSDSNMLLMQINTGKFVVGKGVEFFRKLPKPTEEELEKAKKLIDEYCKREFGSGADFSEFPEVELAYTEDCIEEAEEHQVEIQVSADLQSYTIKTRVEGKMVEIERYKCMEDFIEYALDYLDFDSLVSLSEDALAVARGEKEFVNDCGDVCIEWGHGIYLSNVPSEIDFAELRREYGKEPEPNERGEYDIEIREVLSRTESVKAGYLGEAIDELMDKYRKGEIILDADDFKGVDYIPVEKKR